MDCKDDRVFGQHPVVLAQRFPLPKECLEIPEVKLQCTKLGILSICKRLHEIVEAAIKCAHTITNAILAHYAQSQDGIKVSASICSQMFCPGRGFVFTRRVLKYSSIFKNLAATPRYTDNLLFAVCVRIY